MNAGKVFLDTNVLIYAWNHQVPEKQSRAISILEEGHAVVSWQVIQEFCNVALRKFTPPLPVAVLEQYVVGHLDPICAVYPSRILWSRALRIHAQSHYAFYDSLIVASALASGAEVLFSEDLQHGRRIQGLEIQNPFL